ncbi:hypothetical protein ACFQ0I_15865 [Mariniflexile aquimaris]|uniref:Uncharacterized protein n=1 Tax=Mariniflexile aquimaris TaxID=881009 RepID=A0ABW3BVY1_9FLAO
MKKIKIYLILLLVLSCYQKNNTIQINDFSKSINDILIPKENGSYSNASIEIKGDVNDTIIIKFYNTERKYIGSFKDKLIGDYYGSLPVEFNFDPYKATKGQINVTYGIN